MKSKNERELDFYATITMGGSKIENILCRAHLPLKLTDSIELHFYPTEEQLKILSGVFFWKYSVKGEAKSQKNESLVLVDAEIVFSNNLISYPHSKLEPHLVGEPGDLKTIHLLNHHIDEQKVYGNFWITPSRLLQPAFISERSYTGEVKITIARDFDFNLDNDVTLKFNNYHKNYTNQEGDDVSFYELVASFEINNATNDSPVIIETFRKLKDVLLLTSFLERKRIVCLGWDAYDAKTLVKKYLRNETIPKDIDRKVDRHDLLIDLSDYPEFLRTVFPNFQNYHDIEAFRRMLNFIIPSYEDTIDSSFVSLYSSLEMIVLHFRRKQNLEFILPTKVFEKVRKEIKKVIEASTLIEPDSSKLEMKKKLSELNRISFASAFDEFCNFYEVDLSDLWSVNSNNEGISLSQIRNKLVHGEHFSQEHYHALFYAREHLRWAVERMILSILGWSFEKSNVSPDYLRIMNPYQNWRNVIDNFN